MNHIATCLLVNAVTFFPLSFSFMIAFLKKLYFALHAAQEKWNLAMINIVNNLIPQSMKKKVLSLFL